MLIAQLSEISKSFGSHEILEQVHWQISDGARIALVGRNGAGKTTLFRILSREIEQESGTYWTRKNAVVVSLEQEVRVDDRRSLRDEAARGLKHLEDLQEEFTEVTGKLGAIKEGDPEADELLSRYGHLQDRLEREGAYSFESKIKEVLTGLHFTEEDLDRPLAEFSGGQKSRASLARVLLRDPDLLLLDEPTNHLDLDAIEWLERFLLDYSGAYVLVSHDRMFVNRLARNVAELRYRKLHHFRGNYDRFLEERERRLLDQAKKYELQQEEIRRQEDFIRKNIVGQKTKQAQSRRKMLEKMERLESPEWPASSIRMNLPEPVRLPRIVVEAKDLAKNYGDLHVFSNSSFSILRGQKVGLIGPNGVGKTTLLRIVVGEVGQTDGTVRLGPGVQIGYFEQEQARIRGTQSVLDEVWAVTPQVPEAEIRGFLGGFLFRGEDVFKPLNVLSGGERSRVALAKLVREGANLLVLDEPTNHLDIESREVIEAALRAYTGCVLVVSHDRYFLDRVVDHVVEVRQSGTQVWDGGYSEYVAARTAATAKAAPAKKPAKKPPSPAVTKSVSRTKSPAPARPKAVRNRGTGGEYEERKRRKREEERLRRRVTNAEGEISRLESERESISFSMADPALATEAHKLQELQASFEKTSQDLQAAITEWERLSLRLDAFLDGATT